MLRRFSPRYIFVTIVCFVGLAQLSPANAAEKWLRLSSENFEMLSCTSESSSRRMLVQLEQFRAAFLSVFPYGRAYDQKPLIFVFDTKRQFKPYTVGKNGKVKEIAGLFASGPIDSCIAFHNDDIEQGLSTIFHEYVHALVAARGWRPPLFFNEGIAEIFSTLQVSGDKVTLGQEDPHHVSLLRQKKLIPLGTFFAVGRSSPYYNESEKMNIFYAQSWLTMHYLIWGQKSNSLTTKNLGNFMQLAEIPGITVSDAFHQGFGVGYEELEAALQTYLSGGKYYKHTSTIPAEPIKQKITCRPATDRESQIEITGLRWRVLDAADTKLKLLQYMDAYPDDPRPYEIMASVEMGEGERKMAMDYLEKAAARKSKNPMAYIWLLREHFNGSSFPMEYVMPDDMSTTYRTYIDRALELAPDCMEAYILLAMVESQCAQLREVELNKVVDAVKSMKNKERALLALSVCYWRLKMYDAADELAEKLLATPSISKYTKFVAEQVRFRIAKEQGNATEADNPVRKYWSGLPDGMVPMPSIVPLGED